MQTKKQPKAKMTAVNNGVSFPQNIRNFVRIILLITATCSSLFAQDSLSAYPTVNKKKLRSVIITSASAYTVGMAGLYNLWYKNSEQQSFRFFNDNHEWKQVDKIGHFGSAFYMSYGAHRALTWSDVPKKRSDLIASATGFLVLLPIEVFDGFSNAYGASTGDLIANAGGAAFFFGQQVLWDEIRIYPKFSFHKTRFAALRPEVLGNNGVSQFFKDYNGQTYWFSLDMDKFSQPFPKWLNIAVGYGAENMIYARDNANFSSGLTPYRQFYLSLDFDLTAIRTRSKTLKTLIFLANILKIPAPTVSFSSHGTRAYAFYF